MLFRKTLSFKKMLFKEIFTFKIMLFGKYFSSKSCVLKMRVIPQSISILRGKFNQDVIFCVQHFFQNLLSKTNFFFKIVLFRKTFFFKNMLFKNIFFLNIWSVVKFFNSKSNAAVFFQSKIVGVVRLWNQNLRRCENFVSKSAALENFNLKIRQVVKRFLRNLIFILFFRFRLDDDNFCQS